MLVVSCGVNSCGKDTIFNKYVKNNPGSLYLSSSQLLMVMAGILDEYTPGYVPSRENYLNLEKIEPEKRDRLMNINFGNELKKLSEMYETVIVPIHLVIAKVNERGGRV